jgi:hypothetical protein
MADQGKAGSGKNCATFLLVWAQYKKMANRYSSPRLISDGSGLRRSESTKSSCGPTPSILIIALASCLILASKGSSKDSTSIELSPLLTKSTLLGPLDESKEIGVALSLPLSDPKGASDFIDHISHKGDPLYHHYLTPLQFAQRFGGNAEDYAALKQWALANGFRISQESVGRINLTVRGSVSQFQKIFHTQINRYRGPNGSEFYSAGVAPTIPTAIVTKISGVIGLTGGKQYAPAFRIAQRLGESPVPPSAGIRKASGEPGTGPGGTYSAKDLRIAYSIPTFGTLSQNSVVAVFEQGGFTLSDVTEYLDTNDLPHAKISPVSVDNSPTTVSDPDVELEAVLDIDMVIGINPSVDEVRVYEDSIDTFQTALLDAITQVGDEDKAQVLSISYGQDEGYQGTDAIAAENTALQQLATEGITVTASSGDSGAYGDLYNYPYNVSDPASQPYITGVGGTSLYTGIDHGYVYEEAWNNLAIGDGATGGGISSYWSFPSYQGVPGVEYMTENGGSATMRNVPDVAAVGNPLTGVGIYSKINGGWILIGGTSVASPIWAAYLSIIDAAFNYTGLGNLGFFNPALYAVGTSELGAGDPADYLYDITIGSNGDATLYPGYPGYSNGPNYSNTTGNGSLWGGGFAAQLMISGTASGTGPGAISNFSVVKTTNTTATLKWNASAGAAGYVVGVYTDGNYGFSVEQSLVTKDTTITIPDLTRGQDYWVYLWAFNGSGGSQYVGPYNFVPGSLSSGSGVEERVLTPTGNLNDRLEFGSAIAIDGETLLIGEPQAPVKEQLFVGEVHVFLEPSQGWGSGKPANVAKLTASDASSHEYPRVGSGVAISGDTIAVNSSYEGYVYVRPATGWATATENARLQPPSGWIFSGNTYPGGSIAIDGDTIVVECRSPVGAETGAGAVYVKPPGGWTGDIAPAAVLTDGLVDDLAWQVAISGDTIALGAITYFVGQVQAGAVQVYEKPPGGWASASIPTATLVTSDPSEAYLGEGLSFSGDTIVASTPFTGENGNIGAAYVFLRKGPHWRSGSQSATLTIPTPSSYYPGLGSSVAIHGDVIAAGAPGVVPPDGAGAGGALFFYQKPGDGWKNTAKPDGELYDPNAPLGLELGIATAVQNGTVVGGALTLGQSGAVYIFRPESK